MITACAVGNATSSGNNTVHMNESNFTQPSITIKKGESLTLVSDTAAVHVIENGTWDSNVVQKPDREPGAPKVDAQMNGGDSKTFGPFNTVGTFQLYCPIHNGMNLTVIVK
jgi:plastocyanin